jgi:hypothetical protein
MTWALHFIGQEFHKAGKFDTSRTKTRWIGQDKALLSAESP